MKCPVAWRPCLIIRWSLGRSYHIIPSQCTNALSAYIKEEYLVQFSCKFYNLTLENNLKVWCIRFLSNYSCISSYTGFVLFPNLYKYWDLHLILYYAPVILHVQLEGLKGKDSKFYWIQKQIEPLYIHPLVSKLACNTMSSL